MNNPPRWQNILYKARSRCRNPKNIVYQYYGGRGIKCFLTPEDMAFLWTRDNGDALEKPSIDRIDNDSDYTLENCRFIENSHNTARINGDKIVCKRGHSKWSPIKTGRECLECKRLAGKVRYETAKQYAALSGVSTNSVWAKAASLRSAVKWICKLCNAINAEFALTCHLCGAYKTRL